MNPIPATPSPTRAKRYIPSRKRCGQCEACLREDCGECMECIHKRKFGGDGTSRQACLRRICLITNGKSTTFPKSKTGTTTTTSSPIKRPKKTVTPISTPPKKKKRGSLPLSKELIIPPPKERITPWIEEATWAGIGGMTATSNTPKLAQVMQYLPASTTTNNDNHQSSPFLELQDGQASILAFLTTSEARQSVQSSPPQRGSIILLQDWIVSTSLLVQPQLEMGAVPILCLQVQGPVELISSHPMEEVNSKPVDIHASPKVVQAMHAIDHKVDKLHANLKLAEQEGKVDAEDATQQMEAEQEKKCDKNQDTIAPKKREVSDDNDNASPKDMTTTEPTMEADEAHLREKNAAVSSSFEVYTENGDVAYKITDMEAMQDTFSEVLQHAEKEEPGRDGKESEVYAENGDVAYKITDLIDMQDTFSEFLEQAEKEEPVRDKEEESETNESGEDLGDNMEEDKSATNEKHLAAVSLEIDDPLGEECIKKAETESNETASESYDNSEQEDKREEDTKETELTTILAGADCNKIDEEVTDHALHNEEQTAPAAEMEGNKIDEEVFSDHALPDAKQQSPEVQAAYEVSSIKENDIVTFEAPTVGEQSQDQLMEEPEKPFRETSVPNRTVEMQEDTPIMATTINSTKPSTHRGRKKKLPARKKRRVKPSIRRAEPQRPQVERVLLTLGLGSKGKVARRLLEKGYNAVSRVFWESIVRSETLDRLARVAQLKARCQKWSYADAMCVDDGTPIGIGCRAGLN